MTERQDRYEKFRGRVPREDAPECGWAGCSQQAEFKAPSRDGGLAAPHWFCLDHVREYNGAWNYLDGLNEAELERYNFSAAGWHRPTWDMRNGAPGTDFAFADPLDIVGAGNGEFSGRAFETGPLDRPLTLQDREALAKLGLDGSATLDDVKKQYKMLAKQYHPDTNGGSRKAEKRLQVVIEAYNHLLSAVNPADKTQS